MASYNHMKRRVCVLDSYICYSDTRAGEETIIFLHGNPTSSYIWRNIVSHVQGVARCLAPDLLGFGDSGKEAQNSYHFSDHYRYFCAWLDSIRIPGKYIFVCTDLGSMIAFHWSRLHPDRVKAIVHMESIVTPLSSYEDFAQPHVAELYKELRYSQGDPDEVLENHNFLESCLTFLSNSKRKLSHAELKPYREPFIRPDNSRVAMLTAVKEIPILGEQSDDFINDITSYYEWMSESDMPKLYIHPKDGLYSKFVEEKTRAWKNQTVVKVAGRHMLQEDSPEEISHTINEFIKQQDPTNVLPSMKMMNGWH